MGLQPDGKGRFVVVTESGKTLYGDDFPTVNDIPDIVKALVSLGGGFGGGGGGGGGGRGTNGARGATGVQGVTGPFGGPPGETGLQGPTGPAGATGIQGITGLRGATGLQGPTGVQGTPGMIGAQGTTGIQGTTGVQGVTGVGTQGATGIQGVTGVGTITTALVAFNFTSGTATTGALGFTPKFAIYISGSRVGGNANMFNVGLIRGTGADASSAGLATLCETISTLDNSEVDIVGSSASGISTPSGGGQADISSSYSGATITCTAFSATGIDLTWSAVAVSNHLGYMLVVG